MERELKDRLLMQKRILNLLGITEVYALDFKKINYVRKRLDDIKVTFSTGSKVVSKTEGILTGLDDLKIFGEDIFNEAVKNTSVVPFVSEMSNMYVFKTNLSFATNIESLKLCEKGRVESFSVPQNSDEFFRILIGHEFIHSLKDINVLEYSKSQTVLDVIPLFYELIISEKIDFRSLWLNLRFFF